MPSHEIGALQLALYSALLHYLPPCVAPWIHILELACPVPPCTAFCDSFIDLGTQWNGKKHDQSLWCTTICGRTNHKVVWTVVSTTQLSRAAIWMRYFKPCCEPDPGGKGISASRLSQKWRKCVLYPTACSLPTIMPWQSYQFMGVVRNRPMFLIFCFEFFQVSLFTRLCNVGVILVALWFHLGAILAWGVFWRPWASQVSRRRQGGKSSREVCSWVVRSFGGPLLEILWRRAEWIIIANTCREKRMEQRNAQSHPSGSNKTEV